MRSPPPGIMYAGKHAVVAGLVTKLTYNASSTPPAYAGTYAVAATVDDANYTGSAASTLTIAKATAQVTLGNLSFTCDGSSKPLSVTTSPSGLNVDATYNGSNSPPSRAGNYTIVATVNDSNYAGTATGTEIIAQSSASPVPALGLWAFLAAASAIGFYIFRSRRGHRSEVKKP